MVGIGSVLCTRWTHLSDAWSARFPLAENRSSDWRSVRAASTAAGRRVGIGRAARPASVEVKATKSGSERREGARFRRTRAKKKRPSPEVNRDPDSQYPGQVRFYGRNRVGSLYEMDGPERRLERAHSIGREPLGRLAFRSRRVHRRRTTRRNRARGAPSRRRTSDQVRKRTAGAGAPGSRGGEVKATKFGSEPRSRLPVPGTSPILW